MKKNKGKTDKNKPETIPLISFFTGGGFLDIGFEQAGFNVIWTNENNPVFADMYSYGVSNWRSSIDKHAQNAVISNTKSIERVYSIEILRQAFNGKTPGFFGVIGGPPCPDFSVGGKNKGGKGTNGRLSRTYIERICGIMPSFFVFENVPGLYKTRIHREFLAKLERKLEQKGYCLDLKILNALELGVPQDRERLIMIGIKQSVLKKCLRRKTDVSERGWFAWPSKPKYKNAKKDFNWPTKIEYGSSPRKPNNIPEELTVYYWINRKNLPREMQNNNDTFRAKSKKFHRINEGDTRRKSFKRLHRHRFSPTVCYGHNEVHLHPWEPRRLSVREAMRIQGIPDTYALPEDATLTSKFTVVSNGVPVPLAREVAKKLYQFLQKLKS